MNRDIKELINKRTILGSKIASGLLACALLASCGTQPPKNETGDSAKIEEARKTAIETIGGYGPYDKEYVLQQAATLTNKSTKKAKGQDSKKNEITNGYRLIDKIDGQNMLQVLMTEESKTDPEVKKSLFKKKPKKARYLADKISGAYKTFVEAILADDQGDETKRRRGRHGKLLILAEGLSFVNDMAAILDNEEGDAQERVKDFEGKIIEASGGVHAHVIAETGFAPKVEFQKQESDQEQYKLTGASKTAAEKLIKDVQEAREAYRKVYVEETK